MDWFTAQDYWFSRLVFQRGLSLIYVIAFVGAACQFRALIGERGMLPVPRFVARVSARRAPSLFQWWYSDRLFAVVAWGGAALALGLVAGLGDVVPLWAAMLLWAVVWGLYLSIVNVGQVWYGFGWESLLLEAGFLAIFLGNDEVAPPVLMLWLARWLLFRVEFGAGLIKLRGDPCWRDLTCLYYHHETQPMPGPLSWLFHHLPKPIHRTEAAANHVTQLVVPFGLFAPQPVAGVAAAIIICTQLWLVLSGNFAWLNWVTMLLAVTAFPGSALIEGPSSPAAPVWFSVVVATVALLLLVLSYPALRNMLSRDQQMNVSFNPFHLGNTYGAFGSIGRTRSELIIEGTDETELTEHTVWREYEFKGKPSNPRRRPRQFAPYHLRLDWMMWFAAIAPHAAQGWLLPLLHRLLAGDKATLLLLQHNPFPGKPPEYVRIIEYHYRFTSFEQLRRERKWWTRSYIGQLVAPIRLSDNRFRGR